MLGADVDAVARSGRKTGANQNFERGESMKKSLAGFLLLVVATLGLSLACAEEEPVVTDTVVTETMVEDAWADVDTATEEQWEDLEERVEELEDQHLDEQADEMENDS
jgi:tryptophan 2,3-dioxygenase